MIEEHEPRPAIIRKREQCFKYFIKPQRSSNNDIQQTKRNKLLQTTEKPDINFVFRSQRERYSMNKKTEAGKINFPQIFFFLFFNFFSFLNHFSFFYFSSRFSRSFIFFSFYFLFLAFFLSILLCGGGEKAGCVRSNFNRANVL